MTLAEIRATFPDLFYEQNWFDGQAFMHIEPRPMSAWFWASEVPIDGQRPIRAVDLAALYVRDPERTVWRNFYWTDDIDHLGNRVYVSGVGKDDCPGFQIHRHLANPEVYWVGAA